MNEERKEPNPFTNETKISVGSYEVAMKGYWERWKTLEQNGQCHNCDESITEITCAGRIRGLGYVCEKCWKKLIISSCPS